MPGKRRMHLQYGILKKMVILQWFYFGQVKKSLGFIAKKGTFSLNDTTKTIKLNFDSTYTVYSKDSFSVNKDFKSQEWHLITFTNYKIVISRPPVWEFENKKINYNSKNISVTLVSRKKRRSDLKLKG